MSNEQHRIKVHQYLDKSHVYFYPTCSCGWRDRMNHESRQAAQDSADDHVLAAI